MSQSETPPGINPELWEFPCQIAFKTMAVNRNDIDIEVLSVVQNVVPGDYAPQLKPSTKGNYVSITIHLTLHSCEQVEQLYREVRAIPDVKMCL